MTFSVVWPPAVFVLKEGKKTYPETHHRCRFHDFEIESGANLSYKKQESLRIFVHSRFEEDEFEVRVLRKIHIIKENFSMSSFCQLKWSVYSDLTVIYKFS